MGFIAAISALLVVQAIVLVRLADANDEASNAERLVRQERTRLLSQDLSRTVERNPGMNLDLEVLRLSGDDNVFVVLRDGRVAGRRLPRAAIVDTVVTGLNELAPGDSLPASWERSNFAGAPIVVRGGIVGAMGIVPRTAFERFGIRIVTIAGGADRGRHAVSVGLHCRSGARQTEGPAARGGAAA